MKAHENYQELIWVLAKTDFKLRYHGSLLGYIWAILKPLLMFTILNFVFSSIFNPRNTGTEHYSLQLLASLILFNFFSEGTMAGLGSLLNKSQLVTKIYVPRWTIILASSLNVALIFLMNLLVVVVFFAFYQFVPSLAAVLNFLFLALLTYLLILAFSFVAAPLFLKFRDLLQIWDVLLSVMFYASPIVYPLAILPAMVQKIILFNPLAFIIHFAKVGLTENHFPDPVQLSGLLIFVFLAGGVSFLIYKKMEKRIAENV